MVTLPFPPMYFLSLLHFLIPHLSLFPYFLFCPALPLPKSCWACPLQVPPPSYFLSSLYPSSRTSLSCGFYLYCVSNAFLLNVTICFGPYLSNVVVLTLILMHQLRLFVFLSVLLDFSRKIYLNFIMFFVFLKFIASAVTVCLFFCTVINFVFLEFSWWVCCN